MSHPAAEASGVQEAPSAAPPVSGRPGRAFALTLFLAFLAIGGWSLATPLFAAPDEPVHVIKAAAVVRGELVGKLLGGSTSPLGIVSVPDFYATTRNIPACYHRRPTVPASCAPRPSGSARTRQVVIYNARYPPLYYSIVGLPSLLGVGEVELYLMRLVSALLSSAFVALAVATAVAWSRHRVVVVGVVVATTPMVLFLGGVVNPAGLETSAAIATWTAGSVLVFEHLEDPPAGLVGALGLSACVLELSRPISPFWLALTALALVAVAERRSLRAFVAHRRVQVGLAVVFLVGVAATAWILRERSFDVYSTTPVGRSVSESRILETSFLHNDFYLPGMIGVFGWFDTYSPTFTYVVWYGLVGLLALAGAVVGRLRDALTLLVVTVAIVVVPVAISTSQVHRYGFTWAGKDTLPFAVGLPILAAALAGRSALAERRGRLAGVVALAAFLAQVAAFYEMLRRYAVGTAGSDFGFLEHWSWQPPIGLGGALGLEVPALALLAVAAYLVVRPGGRVGDQRGVGRAASGASSGRLAAPGRARSSVSAALARGGAGG
jgi:hypothetical protein